MPLEGCTSNQPIGELRSYINADEIQLKRRTELIHRLEECVIRFSGSSPVERIPSPEDPNNIKVSSIINDLRSVHNEDLLLNEQLTSLVERLESLI